jgi:predicted alpha/beta superfamily hydrolase
MIAYVERAPFVPGRVYLDVGTREAASGSRQTREEQADSRAYLASVRQMRDVLLRKGYRCGRDLCYLQERGGIHHESAWARRFPGAVRFLFG